MEDRFVLIDHGTIKNEADVGDLVHAVHATNRGFVLIDRGEFIDGLRAADLVRSATSPLSKHRLRIVNVLERVFPVFLNPLYELMVGMDAATSFVEREAYVDDATDMILGMIQQIAPEHWNTSPELQQHVQTVCEAVLRYASSTPGRIPTLSKVAQALTHALARNGDDQARRSNLQARIDAGLLPPSADLSDVPDNRAPEVELTESQRIALQGLIRRLDMVLMSPCVGTMLSGEVPSVNFLESMETGMILVFIVPRRELGDLAPLVESLILQSIAAASRRGRMAQEN